MSSGNIGSPEQRPNILHGVFMNKLSVMAINKILGSVKITSCSQILGSVKNTSVPILAAKIM